MKLISALSVFLTAFLFTNCGGYNFANFNAQPIPFVHPASTKSNDTTIVSTFFGGKFNHSIYDAYYHAGETNKSGLAYIYQTHTNKNFYYSYGCYGYSGDYFVRYATGADGNKSYFGLGLSGDAGFNIPVTDFLDYHILGIRGSAFYEDGQFTNFRKSINQYTNYYDHSNTYASTKGYNISLTSGINCHLKEFSFGFEGGLGSTSSIPTTVAVLTMNSTTYLTYKLFTFYFQNDYSFLALGNGYSLGLIYRLK